MDLGTEHQWVLTIPERDTARLYMLLVKQHSPPVILLKRLEPEPDLLSGSSHRFEGKAKDKYTW